MKWRPPRSKRTETLFPYTTLVRAQPTPLERCVDGQVDELRNQESDSRGDDQRRRGEGGRQRSTDNDGTSRPTEAQSPLHQVTQDQGQSHATDTAWGGDSWSNRAQARSVGNANWD